MGAPTIPTFTELFVPAYLDVFRPGLRALPAPDHCPLQAPPSPGPLPTGPEGDLIHRWITQLIDNLVTEAHQRAGEVVRLIRAYETHFSAVGVTHDQIPEYLRHERQILCDIYPAVREYVPSPATVRGLVFRYALDARLPLEPPVDRFQFRETCGAWEVGEYQPGRFRSEVLGPLGGFRPVHLLFAGPLLGAVTAPRIDAHAVVAYIELLLGGPPAAYADSLGCDSGDTTRQAPAPPTPAAGGPERSRRPQPSREAQQAILEALKEAGRPLTRKELATKSGYHRGTLGHYAAWMKRAGLLVHDCGKGYTLPADMNQTRVG